MATTLSIAGTSAPDPSIFPKAITLENIAQQTTHKASELALIDRSPMFGMDPPDWRDDHQKAMDEWRQSSAEALDAAVLDPAAYTDERIPGGWTPEEWRKTRAVDDWMRLQQDGEEPPLDGHAREFHRALLAERHFGGKGADSDDALFAEITAAATLRRDERTLAKSIVTTAATDAALPTDKAPGFAAWLKEAQGKPGFDPDKVGDYAAAFVDLRRQMKEREEPIADVLRKSWQAFRTGIESGIPAAEIAQLSREDFSLLLESLRARAEALPDEEKETLLAGMRKDFLRAVEGGYREAGEASVGLMRQGGTVGLEDFFGSDQAVQARRERDANASRSFELRRNRAAEIRRIMHADYDPIDYTKGFKWLQMAPGVTVTSLTMAVPVVGMPFMSSMLLGYAQENAYLKAIDSGMDEDAAGRYSEIIGPAVAVPQIILEKAGYSIWARKLPLFDKVLTKLDDAIANRGLRMLTKTGAITGAETAIELAQDLTETGIQDLANALDSDLPDVDWGTELQGAWRSIPEIAGSMLFLSIFGAAGGLNREARIAAFASASDLELRAAGLNAEGIAGIRAATGPGSTNAAVTSAWQTRDPNSPEAKAAAEELAARERARREAANQLRASGDLPIIVAGADGFTVLDGRTEETVGTAPTMAAAWTMAQAHSDFLADLDADAVAYMKSMLEGADFIKQLDPEQETRLELGTVMDRALVEAERPEMAARFAKQVALKEQAAGGTGEISYTVNGWSESQIRDNLRQTVNRIFQGGSVLTEFHEFMHGRRRKLKAAGQLTRGEEISFLRAIDTVLAGKRTKEGERLSLLPEGITDEAVTEEMIDEAISEVMEMEILRSRQGGRKRTMPSRPGVANVPSGFITRNLTALARLAPEATRKFSAFIEAVRAHFGQAMARAIALKKAEREGKFDADSYDAFLAKLMGLDVQDDFNRQTAQEAARIADPLSPEAFAAALNSDYDPGADDIPFSIARSGIRYPVLPLSGREPVADSSSNTGLRYPDGHEIDTRQNQAPAQIPAGGGAFWDRLSQDGRHAAVSGAWQAYEGRGMAEDWIQAALLEPGADPGDTRVSGFWNWLRDTLNSEAFRGIDPVDTLDALVDIFQLDGYRSERSASPDRLHYVPIAPDGTVLALRDDTGQAQFARLPQNRQTGLAFSLGRSTVTPTADTRAFPGAEGSPSVIGPAAFSIAAWHGTPHQVDRFRLDRIGTGEGAQAYGWGLYFADLVSVAKSYMENVEARAKVPYTPVLRYDGQRVDAMDWPAVKKRAASAILNAGKERAIQMATDRSANELLAAIQELDETKITSNLERFGEPTGNLYRVELDVEADELLDWDKPLSEQSEKVKAFFRDTGINVGTIDQAGWELYEMAARRAYQNRDGERLDPWDNPFHAMGDNGKAASELLQAAGIRGIRYLDGNSRGSGEGSYNYVIFDEAAIKITEENGTPVNLTQESGSFSLGRAPEVWKGFPAVQWLVNTNQLTTKGGELIAVPEYKWKVNKDWYLAKGKGDVSAEERAKAGWQLLHRLFTAAGAERLQAVREFLKSHPDAVLLPIRGLEAPNKHANIIPEIYARLLHASGGNRINDTVHKINTTHNTGKSAAERLQQIHEYEGDIEAGVDYLIVDDVSTTGATAYYLARYIASKGGNVAGIMQLGLTPRGKAEKFKPKPYVGDEHVLEMTPATRKALQAKGDDATINNVVQTLGIAYDWRTLTDALARALTANWSAVRRSVGTMSAGGRSNPAGSDGRGFAAAGSGGNAARGLPAFPGEIEAAGGGGAVQGTLGFSLAPSRSLDLMRMNALDRVRNPRRRAEIFQRISREFERLKLEAERFELIAGTKRLRKSLAKEAAMREAKAREDFENDVYARHWELLSNEDLVKIKSQPLHAYLADPASPLRGRLMSRSAAIKHRAELFGEDYKGGEWDGSDGLSRSLFGGSLTPDQAAQELYDAGLISDPYVDTMWQALHSEQAMVSGMKERLAQVKEELRQARVAAKEEANAWLRHAQGNQEVNYSPKQEILRALASMQAILRALPPPVRAKIGGIMDIARAGSEEARLQILKETIAKSDRELEKWMRETLDREFRELLDKTRPERDEAGKRPKGKIGADIHDLFRSVEAAMFLSADETEAEATRLEALAEMERTTPEQAAHLTMEANLVRLVGNWSKADAARREMALAEAASAYAGGYMQAQIKAAQKRERITRRRADLKQDTGKAGERMERVQAELENRGSKLGRTKEALLSVFSFDQMLGLVFGEDSATARTFADWELRAANAKEDAIQRTHNAVEALLNDLAGNPLAGEKLRHKLSTERSVEWIDWKGRKQTATEMEAVSYTLWWAQEDGKRHMEGLITENPDGSTTVENDWHWREEDVASIERQLSKEAKAIRLHLRENYGAEYDRINAVFSDLYGVNMPRHKDYSPISVAPSHAPGGQMADPVSGAMQGPGLTPGSLKNRSHSAVAEPQRMDALQHYVAHVKQMEHFIAYAQLSSELMAIVNHRELGNSIEAKAGKEALNILRAWTDYFAQGGTRDAAAHLAVSGWFQRGLDRISQMALVGRASVLAIQSVQLGAAAYQMPVASYLKRLAKLTTGQLGWGKAIRSDYIQRRLAQMPPAVQQAMQGLASGKPNALKYSTAKLGRLISGADALFTAGTYAIIQDYQLKLAKERGMPNPEQWAEQEAIRLTDQVAQPMRAGARSLIEVTATGPAFRMMWAFASEPRQKLALSAYGLMQKKGIDRFKGFAVTWTVSGMLAAVVRAAVRDLRDDGEDDEVFDERNWDPTKLALMALSGPFGGLPIVGKEIEASIYAGAGEYLPGGTLISGPSKAVGTGKKLVSGGAEWETAIKDAETIFAGIGVADPTAAALTSWLHIARDLEALYRNLTED